MRLHTGKTINTGLARAYALNIKDVRKLGLRGSLALLAARELAADPRFRMDRRQAQLLIEHDILEDDGSMGTEMRAFLLACTRKSPNGDFCFVDPQTGK